MPAHHIPFPTISFATAARELSFGSRVLAVTTAVYRSDSQLRSCQLKFRLQNRIKDFQHFRDDRRSQGRGRWYDP
eukprot:3619605-Rhodomonas_salina.1